jgi:hypothetical protein
MSTPSSPPHPLPLWKQLLLWAAVALVLMAVFALYLLPEFMVTLADQVWACF